MWYKGNTRKEVTSIPGVLTHSCLGFHLLICSSSTQFPLDPELPWKPPHYGSLWSVVSELTYGCLFKHYMHIPLDCILRMF